MNKIKNYLNENPGMKKIALGVGIFFLILISLWAFNVFEKKPVSQPVVQQPIVTTPTTTATSSTNTTCVSSDEKLLEAQKALLDLQNKKVEIKKNYEQIARNEEYLSGKKVTKTRTVYRKVYVRSNENSSNRSSFRNTTTTTNISTQQANQDCWAKLKPELVKQYGLRIEMRGQQAMVVFPDGTPYKGEHGQPFIGGSVKEGTTEVIGGGGSTGLKKLKSGYHYQGNYIISEKTGMKVTGDDYPFEN